MSRSREVADSFTLADTDYWKNSNFPDPLQTQFADIPATTPGWYTIATVLSARAVGTFILRDRTSSSHHSVHFEAGISFGRSPKIRVEHNVYHIRRPFRYLRIMDGGVYDGAMLQVNLDTNSSGWQVWLYDNTQSQGWSIKAGIPAGTDPGGVADYSVLTNQNVLTDLNY